MKPIVPFAHGFTGAERDVWLSALQAPQPAFEIVPAELLTPAQARSAQVAIVANPDPAVLSQLPNLLWVQSLWAGVERLMIALPNPKVRIARLIDACLTETMAEAVLAWTLYLHRDMPRYAAQQAEGIWLQWPVPAAKERVVAVLGLGELGGAAASRLAANGFTVLGWSRSPKTLAGIRTFSGENGLSQVLLHADIVIVLLPLTPQTLGLISHDRLREMKAGSSLINFARGAVVDNDALIAALNTGALDHAVLDVFATEPLPPNSGLWTHPSITVLPHISAPTGKRSASKYVIETITKWFEDGTTPTFVTAEKGY